MCTIDEIEAHDHTSQIDDEVEGRYEGPRGVEATSPDRDDSIPDCTLSPPFHPRLGPMSEGEEESDEVDS